MRSKAAGDTRKRNAVLAAVCQVLGLVILLAVIVTALPLCLPRLFGWQVYHVISPSMEPAIPVGSAVYVKQVVPEEILPGDVIAYRGSSGAVITHRVVQNRTVEGQFITKGDANEREDAVPISYGALYGRAALHIPFLGSLLQFYVSGVGKLYAIGLAACGLMFSLLANRLRDRARNGKTSEDPVGPEDGE
jgi:signal peptidase